jgi:hypothetical protein
MQHHHAMFLINGRKEKNKNETFYDWPCATIISLGWYVNFFEARFPRLMLIGAALKCNL